MSKLMYGNCVDCQFSQRVPKDHWLSEHYKTRCVRFPPKMISHQDIWSEYPGVSNDDGCWEWKAK